ncbi:hypothetical protein MNBD_PLANCTO02-2616 [hydrothermal vent metagenome]|uniref:Uncharacterized protein n=1 Tax=hydrothermal vent metagenome TaxID=652676 RepID=A0A3B1DVQ9_9ZZZZ
MINFFEREKNLHTFSDDQFLSEIQWKGSASSELRVAAEAGDVTTAALELQKALCCGRTKQSNSKKKETLFVPVLWSQHAFEETPRTADLADELQRATTTDWDLFLGKWLKKITPSRPVSSYELLILLELLPQIGKSLTPLVFWELWRVAFSASVELSHRLEEPAGSWPTRDQILLEQGELPWVAGGLFCDVKRAAQFRKCGRNLLRKELVNCIDDNGIPQAELFPSLLFWLAVFVRVSNHATKQNVSWWDDMVYHQFRNMIKMLTRMLRSDGSIPFGNGTPLHAIVLLKQAARVTQFGSRSRTFRLLQNVEQFQAKGQKKTQKTTALSMRKNYPVFQSDWGEVASLRSDWSPQADLLTVTYHQEIPQLELSVAGKVLLSGKWDIAVAIDGEPVPITNDWTCSCWSSDEDADYLELHLQLTDTVQIERQVLLSRTDSIALLADVVSGAGDARVDYSSWLPIAKKVIAESDIPTREWSLQQKGLFARVFPLALPQDRVQSVAGRFGLSENQEGTEKLELKQAALGGVYAPLLLSWHPRRKREYVDWRKLTVTHDGERLKSDAASGHRLRMGGKQWFLYHNVNKAKQSRTVLGHHTLNETVFGLFNTNGEVEPVLLVE